MVFYGVSDFLSTALQKRVVEMRKRKIRNRLMELMQERERKIGRRLKQRDVARAVGTADHTIMNWLRNEVSRFDSDLLERMCEFFECEVGDLIYLKWVEEDEPAADDAKNEGES
jgi:putative transcriptional regulator